MEDLVKAVSSVKIDEAKVPGSSCLNLVTKFDVMPILLIIMGAETKMSLQGKNQKLLRPFQKLLRPFQKLLRPFQKLHLPILLQQNLLLIVHLMPRPLL